MTMTDSAWNVAQSNDDDLATPEEIAAHVAQWDLPLWAFRAVTERLAEAGITRGELAELERPAGGGWWPFDDILPSPSDWAGRAIAGLAEVGLMVVLVVAGLGLIVWALVTATQRGD